MGEMIHCYNLVLCMTVICSGHAVILESIYWNTSNTKFTQGEGLVLFPQIGDKVDIVCPRLWTSSPGKEEYYRVYLVTRSQMERCIINKTDTPLLNCVQPHADVKFTFKFQEFSPNLWGLEFLKGRDYFITSTSTSMLQGLDNTNGGVCLNKSMKLVLRVGQSSSDPLSTFQESPTRFPSKKPKFKSKDNSSAGSEIGETSPSGISGLQQGLFIGIGSGCAILVLAMLPLLVLLFKRHNQHCFPDVQQSASVPLNTLVMSKRESISSENHGPDCSDGVFPMRASENMLCRHYECMSADYGPPVYIVQEIPPQIPTNIYYKNAPDLKKLEQNADRSLDCLL